MAKYVYTMRRVSKMVPPQRSILKDISLNFFPGAKIGVLGLNGSGKSSLLKIMAGVDEPTDGEVVRMPGINVGYLPQEPALDAAKTVREKSSRPRRGRRGEEAARADLRGLSEDGADFDKLAAEQARWKRSSTPDTAQQARDRGDALRLPPWDAEVEMLSGAKSAAWRCASCCCQSRPAAAG
jgi:sulfate-transporting ATPase